MLLWPCTSIRLLSGALQRCLELFKQHTSPGSLAGVWPPLYCLGYTKGPHSGYKCPTETSSDGRIQGGSVPDLGLHMIRFLVADLCYTRAGADPNIKEMSVPDTSQRPNGEENLVPNILINTLSKTSGTLISSGILGL